MIHGTLERRVIPGLRQGNTRRTWTNLVCQEVRKCFKRDGVMSKGQRYHTERGSSGQGSQIWKNLGMKKI